MPVPAEQRPPTERDWHTEELPDTPQRDFLIPAPRWVEAPDDLRDLGADFGVALAIGSAVMGVAMPGRLVAFGEIGLAGEVRQVPHAAQRMAEAARLGFRQAFVPKATPAGPPDLELIRVDTLGDAVALMQRRRGQTSHPARARPLLTPVS